MENRIYLDHAATSWPKPPELSASFAAACVNLTANSGRSGYRESVESARVIFDAREALCAILGVADSENIIFTRGCTEGLNLILRGLLKPGDRVGVSPLEHNSVMRPLRRLVQERNIIAETLPAGLDGQLDFGLCRKIVQERRFNLICVAHASNVNGVIQDLTALRAVFAEVPLLVDAAQTAGVLPLNIEQEEIDFLCCSAHKGLLGPTGVGIAYLSPLYELAPLYDGGTGSHSESYEQPLFRPDRYESGTMNIHGIAAFQGVLSGFAERGLLGEKTLRLTQTLIEELSKLPTIGPKTAQR
ncbi:MAG TPA: aminotransferase class V-fold PLP-dependent enzyme, partial [Oligoflexia bacterium]|nr:aminotransferase class V-fold PLP-dependent enzyme [Oligoflexia bacterium]